MNIRLISTVAGVLGLAGLALAGPALAQTTTTIAGYPPGVVAVSVNRTDPPAGGTVEVSGTATPNSTVTFSIGARVLGTAFTNNAGAFRAAVTIPCEITGAQTLRTTGPGVNASTPLNITGSTTACVGADTATTTGSLPRTGSSSTAPLAAAGAGLVLIGAATAVTARRRRAADSI